MAKRTPKQQTKHDNIVKETAQYYKSQDYKVEADIKGFNSPSTINGRRPDVVAKKAGRMVIVEVETRDSLIKDKSQQKVFQNYAEKHKNVRFLTKIAK